MGFFCRCKKCGLDFVDQYGEFINNDNIIECPICKSIDIWLDDDIPENPPFNDLTYDEILEKLGSNN